MCKCILGCLFGALLLVVYPAQAQQLFNEGVITYRVNIDPPADHEGVVQYSGNYIITIKGKQVKAELKLDNGFTNTMLYNFQANTVYSLRKINNRDYAIQLDLPQLQSSWQKFEGYTIKATGAKKTIAKNNCVEANLVYKNGSTIAVFYNPGLMVPDGVFERFPALKGLPLSYSYNSEDGTITRFEATNVLEEPVENAVFKIPARYKMMSYADYKAMSSK
ncbi:MAG: hypothetical protein JST82_08640 [Bacteroidetes bacterium]|nr:hypothetical protein [Bacteroidota bacterium]